MRRFFERASENFSRSFFSEARRANKIFSANIPAMRNLAIGIRKNPAYRSGILRLIKQHLLSKRKRVGTIPCLKVARNQHDCKWSCLYFLDKNNELHLLVMDRSPRSRSDLDTRGSVKSFKAGVCCNLENMSPPCPVLLASPIHSQARDRLKKHPVGIQARFFDSYRQQAIAGSPSRQWFLQRTLGADSSPLTALYQIRPWSNVGIDFFEIIKSVYDQDSRHQHSDSSVKLYHCMRLSLQALHEFHCQHQTSHGDVRFENMLWCRTHKLKMIDQRQEGVDDNGLLQNSTFAPPELIDIGEDRYAPDIFALGLGLCRMISCYPLSSSDLDSDGNINNNAISLVIEEYFSIHNQVRQLERKIQKNEQQGAATVVSLLEQLRTHEMGAKQQCLSQLHAVIDTKVEHLKEAEQYFMCDLLGLLKDMTASNPYERPTIAEIFCKLDSVNDHPHHRWSTASSRAKESTCGLAGWLY